MPLYYLIWKPVSNKYFIFYLLKIELSKNVNKEKIKIELFHLKYDEELNNVVVIKVYYLPNTEYNLYKYDSVIFYIELNDKYKDRPKITCHSNVNKSFLIFIFIVYI